MIQWPELPQELLFPKHLGTESQHHDPHLEALRWRLNKRIEYVSIPEAMKLVGQVGFVACYLDQTILLREDFSYGDESLALCHELLHVCLHPKKGDGGEITDEEYKREERVVNLASDIVAQELQLGNYADFASRFTLPHPLPAPDPAASREAEQLAREALDEITTLQPQVWDWYYEERKENPIAEAADVDTTSGIAARARLDRIGARPSALPS
jgi:hypothetical protein